MTGPPLFPAGAPLIGRRAELDRLQAALKRSRSGEPQVVFIGGETGIGKSRLVAELATMVRDQGGLVLLGAAPVLVGHEIPFAPVAAILRSLEQQVPADRYLQLIPPESELARLLPGRAGAEAPPPDAGNVLRLFERFLTMLTSLAHETELAVVFEDLHWADASTRELVAYLVRNLAFGRITLVGSYRSTDISPGHPLSQLLVEAARQRPVVHLDLGPLSAEEAGALATALQAAADPAEASADVVSRSGGNPLFIEELARMPPGGELPASLANLLRDRLSRLGGAASEFLRLAAVAGASVPALLLEEAAEAVGVSVPDAVSEARSVGMLEVRPEPRGESYGFRHPLVQESIYAELTASERRRLHRAMAEVIERHLAGNPGDRELSLDLARHWWSAGDAQRARPALVAAAEVAESMLAFVEAHGLYERAVSTAPDDTGKRLFVRAAQAASLAGRPERALELLALGPNAGSPEPGALALRAQYLWEAGDQDAALAAYRSAVAALLPDPSASGAARVLRTAARCLLLAGEHDEARQLAERAVKVARTSAEDAEESYALYTLGAARAELGDLGGAEEALKEARDLDARRESRSRVHPRPSRVIDMLAGYWSEATILSRTGRSQQSAAAALQGLRRLKALGVKRVWGSRVGTAAAEELIDLGRWGEALEVLEGLLADGGGAGPEAAEVHGVLSYLLVLTGSLAAAGRHLAAAEAGGQGAHAERARPVIARATAELGSWTGQLSSAADELDAIIGSPAVKRDPRRHAELLALGLRLAADWRRAATASRDDSARVSVDARLGVYHSRVVKVLEDAKESPFGDVVGALLLTAGAEYARARGTVTVDEWTDVSRRWDALGHRYRAAYARWRAAEVALSSAGNREAGSTLLAGAQRACLELGAEMLRRSIEDLARSAGIGLEAATSGPSDTTASGAQPLLALSSQQREILDLLAEGRTDRQIAEALFLSDSEVAQHVSHTLDKLGVNSRVEAAAIAAEAGLVATPGSIPVVAPVEMGEIGDGSRQTMTLMFTDIVKSTALLEAIGDDAWSQLVTWHDATLRSLFRGHAGSEVDHAGDGFFVAFPDVVAALDCAIAIQRTLAEHRRRAGFAPRLRIAVHTAQVTRHAQGYRGRGVHEAARIAGGAGADEVLISTDSLSAIDGRYVRLEPRQLVAEGFSEAISVVPVRWQQTGGSL